MHTIQDTMINQAINKHGNIFPSSNNKSLYDCFTITDDMVIFWYNTIDNSTHTIIEKII